MAECIVEVCRIDQINNHPNADALELAHIKGWQCVVPLAKYKPGQLVTYIPIDSMIPVEHADRWGITKYLSVKNSSDEMELAGPSGRVRCARLRGEPSFGVIVDLENSSWLEGENVRDHYGIIKYIPPMRTTAGDAEQNHPLFTAYTDVENLRNFPDILVPGEEISVTEKLHGTNCRVGLIEGERMAGSMGLRRKRPENDEDMATSTYWFPFTLPSVAKMVDELGANHRQFILFGEVYGSKIQDLAYGCRGRLGFRAFDIFADGKYLSVDEFTSVCGEYGVETVPFVFRGPFEIDAIRELSKGNTTMGDSHIREGVVVKPVVERTDPKVGRVILKYIGDQYLFSKSADKDTNDV